MASIVAFFVTLMTDSLNAQESPPSYDPQQVPVPQRPPVAGLAKESYTQNCAPCHGASGDGDGPAGAAADPTVFSDPAEVWERSPAELFFVTKFGRIENLMPPWRNSMSDEQIWQVVYYAWNLHTDEKEVAEGGEMYAQSCLACHGEGGRGDGPESGPGVPDFAAQDPMIFLSQAELEGRWRESHPELGSDWSAAAKQGVLEYIRSFSYQPKWAPFDVTGPGRITGQLFQGTQDGPALHQTEVTLNVYQQTNLVTTRISPIGADGSFEFENLPVDEGFYFLVETEHRNVRYTSPILAFSGPDFTEGRTGPDRISTTLPVFETTTDPDGLHVTRANWIIEHEPGNLLIGQLYTFGNRSGRTFTGIDSELFDVPVTLAVPLPEGALEVEIQDGMVGEAYRMDQQTLYDTRPVLPGPGSRQIFIRFRLPYAGESARSSFPVPYETELLNLLVADLPGLEVDFTVEGESLEFAGEETVQGVLFHLWSAPFSGDQPVVLSLRGLIAAGGSDPRPARNTQPGRELPVSAPPLDFRIPLAFGGAVTVVLLASLLLFVHRERTRSPLTAEQLAARGEELIDSIARLDDLYALGELEEGDWRKKRAELKRELIDIALAESKLRATE
ncbi:MAG: c-type cytochrome [Caldilineaceae bacterium]|nr:c-type cytochrome [Caldilineaceae bacterium]